MDSNVQTNFRRTCRTCLRVLGSRKELFSLFDVDQNFPTKKFSEMLTSFSQHQVYENDDLPKRVCLICLQQIRGAFFFKSQAENAYNVLMRQLELRNVIPAGSVKKEKNLLKNLLTNESSRSELPIILAPRTIRDVEIIQDDDMLVEIEPPKLQEQFNGYTENVDEDDSDDQEFIDYEPDFSDDDAADHDESPQASTSGKSPDSGILDDACKILSPDENASAAFNEIQLAESQLEEMKQFECNLCMKQMISFKALIRHKRNFHSDNKCRYCKKKFGNRVQLRLHTRFKHPHKYNEFRLNGQVNPVVEVEPISISSIPECDTCGSKFFDKDALYRHHGECDKKCIECGLRIYRKDFYYIHLQKEHGIKISDQIKLECPFGCLDIFHSEKVLQDHIQRNHPDEKDLESVADTISEGGDSLSNDSRLFSCEHCSSRFSSQRSLTQHTSIKHKNPPVAEAPKTRNASKYSRDEFVDKFMVRKSYDYHRCIPCKKDIHRRSVGLHLRGKHASSKTFRCELCPEAFFRIDYRQRHMTHVHFSQYRCNECELQFDRAYKYDAHMVQHGVTAKNFKPEEGHDRFDLSASNMKYIEDTSTYDFSQDNNPQRRPSIFIGGGTITPAEIPMTKDDFTEKYLLNLSEKFSHCSICQQKMMKGSIISHLLWKHALKKPLKCAFCNERVVKNTARLNHMARCHPTEYKCSECGAQHAKHESYTTHMMQAHNKKVTTLPSSGEEDDLTLAEVRFVSNRNEEEVIEEPESIFTRHELKMEIDKQSSYTCVFCPKSFSCAKNLQIHKSHKHKEQMIEAFQSKNYDNANPMTFEEFRYNYVENISEADIKCLVCDQALKRKNFGNHIKSRHATIGAYKCAICPEAFFRPEHRIQHMSQIHRGMFFCQTCNIQFYRNSRYAKHMKDMHDIEVDSTDDYEVDLSLGDIQFVPLIKKSQEEEMNSSTPSIVHEEEVDEEEEIEETETSEEALSRDEFMLRYIKTLSKDARRCLACDKTVLKGSMFNHLMRFHALTLPYKCPFCDLRVERAQYRIRHLQIFHPDNYKCHECGLQFQTHSKFNEHMLVEHNLAVTTPKAEGEEKDLSSYDVKYVAHKTGEDGYWQEDESMQATDTSVTKQPADNLMKQPSTSNLRIEQFAKPQIKEEPMDDDHFRMHSIFSTEDDSLLQEQPSPRKTEQIVGKEYNYNDFKNKFMVEYDVANSKCLACERIIVKTSACAHFRLWHAITMCYNCELCSDGFQRGDYRQRHMKFVHPEDYKCSFCNIQFHRAYLYKQHMLESHHMKINIIEPKTKDEVDVPLENMKFVEKVPDSIRLRESDGEPARRGGRPSTIVKDPINPEGGGVTYKEFCTRYITNSGEGFYCKICNSTMSKFSVKKHLKRYHATSKSFFCELCAEGFEKPDTRTEHMASVHSDNLKCFNCNVQFYLSSDYVDHMQNTHNMVIRVVTSKNKHDVDVPIERLRFVPQRLNNDDDPTPSTSSTSIASPSKATSSTFGQISLKRLKNTFDDVPDDIELTREQLYGKFFRSIKGQRGLGEPKTKCLACNKIFSSKNRKFHALHNHATMRPLKCEICPQKFFLTNKRIKHMSRRHPDDYKCSVCSIQYDRAHHYANHMQTEHKIAVKVPKIDQNEINVPAHLMRFTKKSTAVRTLAKLNKNPQFCDIGDDSESSSFFLLPQDPLKCSECDEEFDSSRSLRIHMRNHSSSVGYKAIVAEITRARELKALEYVHQCDVCEKKFSAIFALNAHKKFKHSVELSTPESRKRKAAESTKPKYEVECDICEFTSHRRDYIEHHVKAAHKPEFHCRNCTRILSNYNLYMYHMSEMHPKAKENVSKLNKCSECYKSFRTVECLTIHKEKKHLTESEIPENYCGICGVSYLDAVGLEIHNSNHVHRSIKSFVEGRCIPMTVGIKSEPEENKSMLVDNGETASDAEDPFERMLVQKIAPDGQPPPAKRSRFAPSRLSILRSSEDDDKLEYLKFLQCTNGIYKCGICGKQKTARKYMLHHLKQHKEVPTYRCERCDEKFVFKKKYDKHMLIHNEPDEPDAPLLREENDAEEHPKFQEIVKNEISCDICKQNFKLTIMLNRHNSTWHADDNPDKELSMEEQKAKPELGVIKLLRCKHCLEAFIKPSELKDHLKDRHNSESIDQPLECEASQSTNECGTSKSGNFPCDKCRFVFQEKKFLDNHQKFFCRHRQAKSESEEVTNVINEQ